MSWSTLSDNFTDRADVAGLSDAAFRLYIESLVWCNRMHTDGKLPRHMLRKITGIADPEAAAAELVKAGLWKVIGDFWELDWTDQETAEKISARKAKNAADVAAFRRRGELHKAGNHTECTRGCPLHGKNEDRYVSPDVSNDVSPDVTANVSSFSLSPSLPLKREKGKTRAGGAAPYAHAPGHGAPAPRKEPAAAAELPPWERPGGYGPEHYGITPTFSVSPEAVKMMHDSGHHQDCGPKCKAKGTSS